MHVWVCRAILWPGVSERQHGRTSANAQIIAGESQCHCYLSKRGWSGFNKRHFPAPLECTSNGFLLFDFFIHPPITNAFENAPKWEFRLPANMKDCQVRTKLHRSFRLWFWTCCYLSHCQSHDPRSSTKRWIDIGVDDWRCDIVKVFCLPSGKHFSISMFHTPRFLTVVFLSLFSVEPFT